ncbi:MAG: polysaccharide export protein [Methylococcales bacterium]|nr:polysaccharide export protein [Methylococcales bacterium]
MEVNKVVSCSRHAFLLGLVLGSGLALSGCATYPDWMASSGPSREVVQEVGEAPHVNGIQFVDVNGAVAQRLLAKRKQRLFSEAFGQKSKAGYVVGAGDVIEVSVWEAPPAMLFGSSSTDSKMAPATTRVTAFPEQMVSSDGVINMPFAGHVPVAGWTPQQIESEITRRLKDKANQPQVLVRVIRNNTANVTVVGEVTTSARVPLTARGERLLDALAAAGGVRQPVGKMTLQLTRGDNVHALALDTIIRDPKQNIVLQPGDVITALFQPLSFTVLGATGKNEEINFEAQGISLAQALARAGGLQDARADARAVFIFRLEDREALKWASPPKLTPEGKVPVIYQVDLKDPASFFMAQGFPVDNKDVLYVANSPSAELQKFLNMVVSTVFILRSVVPSGGF